MSARISAVAWVAAALVAHVAPVLCLADDGPLNPPAGPIASTPGPEPRRELNLVNTPGDADSFFRITASGSYYLPRSFAFTIGEIGSKNAIEVDADNVTIDFNGFSLLGINNAFSAVRVNPGRRGVIVRNGHIQNFARGGITAEGSSQMLLEGLTIKQVGYGVAGAGGPAIVVNSGSILRDITIAEVGSGAFPNPGVATSNNCTIERVAVTTAAAGGIVTGGSCEVIDSTVWALTGAGINAGVGSRVQGCSASLCTGTGILSGDSESGGSNISDCRAFSNGAGGISAGRSSVVTGCSASGNTGTGIEAWYGSVITACTARANTGAGFISRDFGVVSECQAYQNSGDGFDCAGGGGQVLHCTSTANTLNGIRASADTTVRNCTCDNNQAAGIWAVSSDAKIDGNTCTDNVRGIDVDAPGCLIVRNVCAGNTTNYDIVVSNVVGVIVASPLSAAIVGSAGGAGVGTTDSWANLSY